MSDLGVGGRVQVASAWCRSGVFFLVFVVSWLSMGTMIEAQPLRSARVDGIAAVVGATSPRSGATVILRSDVDLMARIRLAARTDAIPLMRVPSPLLSAVLEELIGQAVIVREADRLRAAQPGQEAIQQERRRLEEEAGGAVRLERLMIAMGSAENELTRIAQRRAYARAFLRANLEGGTVVTDAQVQRVFESGMHPFVGRDLDEVREVLRVWLGQQALEREVARWVEVLRGRTTVRVYASWGVAEE